MNDGPPNWDDMPPGDYPGGGGGGGGKRRANAPQMTPEQMAQASTEFYAWLEEPKTISDLRVVLPDNVDPHVFIQTAKTAVLNKPQLLRESLRQSLLVSIMKAAKQGLLPDGKQGALVPRYDTDSSSYQVAWQPMVWGIVKLGRETGAIKQIRAVIVFNGEEFDIIQGEEDRIEHKVDIDIVEEAYAALNGGKTTHGPLAKPKEFFDRVRAAYCFITATDGTVTKRYMTRQRLVSLWETSKATNGPWNSRWIDEMILKGVILFTAKWIDLDPNSAPAKRFQAALMTDMEVDFDRQGQALEAPDKPAQAALPAPDKLTAMEDAIIGRMMFGREKVPANTVSEGSHAAPAQDRARTQGGAAVETAAPPDLPMIQLALKGLAKERLGYRWFQTLASAAQAVETLQELQLLQTHPTVITNQAAADTPLEVRQDIATALLAAQKRLSVVAGSVWTAPEAEAAE